MGLLPVNKKKAAKETPRNFVIFGGTMHGKTYFADEFPNPLNLNTDGNAEMIETPSINITHKRDSKGKIVKSVSELLSDIILELETTTHTYDTLVLDVIDDIVTLFEQEITEENGVRYVGDVGWGKGHGMLEMMVRVFVMRLKSLSMTKKMNILYLSRLTTIEDNGVSISVPSLKLKWLNIVNGNSDYTILCQKIGKNYIRRVESKRKNFTRDKVDDEQIALLLDSVIGAYDRSQKTSITEAKKIVEQQEAKQEVVETVNEEKVEDKPSESKSEHVDEAPKHQAHPPRQAGPRPARIQPQK